MTAEEIVRSHLMMITGEPILKRGRLIRAKGALAASSAALSPAAAAAVAEAPPVSEIAPWALKGISAYGIGEKITDGQYTNEIVLKLYVEKKRPLSKLAQPVPKKLELPGLPPIHTDVVEIGKIELHGNTARMRPAIPGFSIGLATQAQEAGTFGMLVHKTGEPMPQYLLSNSHAIAASGYANKGDAIIQPGGADGGSAPNDVIGSLTQWVPFNYDPNGFANTVDAAIAEMQPDAASAAIAKLGTPKGINTNLKRGNYVQKIGRTTNLSVARVEDVDLRLPSTYPGAGGKLVRVGFSDLVLVTYYSAPGDSGSPVLDMDGKVVGLHMCGSDTIGVFCKIANVQSELGVEVVTG
ncbi:MAG: hypothetical protein EOP62_15950 [Sphingomonadales bacterium]|nr:MAG: hypothetical protein EOP62_15950 [Sphingomonadales bacterium]